VRRTATVLAALVGVALAALAVPAAALTPRAPGAPGAPSLMGSGASAGLVAAPVRSPALEDVGACMLRRGRGDVLLVIDASGSLQATDPKAARVTAARYLSQRFTDVAARNKLALDLAVSVFSATYEPLLPWTRLTGQSVQASVSPTLGELASRNTGFETDYWVALDGARRQLLDKAKSAGGRDKTCQMIVWVTDGKYELQTRTTGQQRDRYGETKPYAPKVLLTDDARLNEVTEAGRDDLCRRGGLADQVRSSGIRTLAVGLETPRARGDFDFLSAMATGRAGSTTCGAITSPVPGDFWRASSLDDLLFVFNRMVPSPPPETPSGVCVRTLCPEGRVGFVLDASIRSVRALAGTRLDGVAIHLTAPGGARPAVLNYQAGDERQPSRRASVGGLPVEYQWLSPRTIVLTMERQKGRPWTGEWAITFVSSRPVAPGTKARTQLEIQGDLVPSWLNGSTADLRSGEVVRGLRFGVVRAGSGQQVPASEILGKVRLSVALVRTDTGKTVPVASEAKTELGAAHDLVLTDVPAGEVTFRLRLEVTTRDAATRPGTRLADQVRDVPAEVLPPLNFPRVSPDTIDFGRAEDLALLRAAIPVTGPGCVWLQGAGTQLVGIPLGLRDVRVGTDTATARSSCLPVARDAQVMLPLSIARTTTGIGTINGTLQIGLAPEDPTAQRTSSVRVPFTAEVTRSPRGVVRWSVFIVGLLIGLLLPVAVAYLAKWYSARIPGRPLMAGVIPVTLRDGQVLRDGRQLELSHADATLVGGLTRAGARRLEVPAAGVTLRAKTGLNPAKPGYVLVESPGMLAASGTPPYTDRSGVRARLPLSVHNTWVVLTDGAAGDVRVLALISGVANENVLSRLSADIRSELPERLAELHSAIAGSAPPPAPPGDQAPGVPRPGWSTPADRGTTPSNPWSDQPGRTVDDPVRAPWASDGSVDVDDVPSRHDDGDGSTGESPWR
jgi:hypothetical protein